MRLRLVAPYYNKMIRKSPPEVVLVIIQAPISFG